MLPSGVSLNNQYSDNEREKTYSLAEHIDGQLQQMSGDVTEVIEHLNSVNSSNQDENNPMYQVMSSRFFVSLLLSCRLPVHQLFFRSNNIPSVINGNIPFRYLKF